MGKQGERGALVRALGLAVVATLAVGCNAAPSVPTANARPVAAPATALPRPDAPARPVRDERPVGPARDDGALVAATAAGAIAVAVADEGEPAPDVARPVVRHAIVAGVAPAPASPTVVPTQPPRRASRLPVQEADVALDAAGQPPLLASPALATLVQQHLGGLTGQFGVAIKALDSGHGVLLNADREFPSASLFKVPVMYEVFRQRDAGRLDLADRLVLTWQYAQLDLGTLDLPVGAALRVDAALQRMIAISDNATANLLADRVGWPSLNATVRDLGLRETYLGSERLTTSPRDMLRLLEVIARGDAPSPASGAAMIDLLLSQRVNDRLPARLPAGTRVAHKTGNLGGIIHDVGIVYAPDAPFAIALLAEDAWDYARVADAQAALTRAVYDYLLTVAAAAPDPTPTPTPLAAAPVERPAPVLPIPTARRWQPPATTPVALPTARLWQSPMPTATPPPE